MDNKKTTRMTTCQKYNTKANMAAIATLSKYGMSSIEQFNEHVMDTLKQHPTLKKLYCRNVVRYEIVGDMVMIYMENKAIKNSKITTCQLVANILNGLFWGNTMTNWDLRKEDKRAKRHFEYKYYTYVAATHFIVDDTYNAIHTDLQKRRLYK